MKIQKFNFLGASIIAVLLVLQTQVGVQARAQSRTLVGVVTHVTDGDTLWVKPASGGESVDVRIHGIDAPESCQDYGLASRQALARHVLNKNVTLVTKARDKYGRVIAKVNLNNQDAGAWMVANGHAWSYHFHKSAGPYAQEEMAARQSGRGLWGSGYPTEPREFRRRTKCHKSRK